MKSFGCTIVMVAAWLCAATAPLARPYSVEDLLATETVRRVEIDPAGRWALIEVQRPWRDAASFDYGALTSLRLGRLLRVDLDQPGPARLAFPQAPDAGYLAGPISPDGAWMVVYRVQADRFEVGLLEIGSGAVRWTKITPELPLWGRAAAWRSRREVLIVSRADGDLPLHLRSRRSAPDRLPSLWRTTQAGVVPSVTRIGSGRFLAERPHAQPNRLVSLTTEGSVRTLARADILDLEISPGGQQAALIVEGDDIQPQPGESVYTAVPTRRRALQLIDLETGRSLRPGLPSDVAPGLLSWSANGRNLLVALWRPDLGRDGRNLVRVTSEGGVAILPAPAKAFDLPTTIDGWSFVRAAWMDETPIAFLKDGAGRGDWYRLDEATPYALTSRLSRPTRTLLAADRSEIVVRDATGEAWAIDRFGRVRQVGDHNAQIPPLPPLQAGARVRENAPAPLRYTRRNAIRLASSETLLAHASRAAILLRRSTRGVQQLVLRRGGSESLLLTLNSGLGDLDRPDCVPIHHAGARGEPLISWLYMPASASAGAKAPLVVIPYRGAVYPTGPIGFEPGVLNIRQNAQVLVGAGYAVLIPSLPTPTRPGAATQAAAEDILRAVDAALARGDLDPGRIALFGHSFGALTAVAAASQSSRFASIIAASGVHDEIGSWGEFVLHYWVTPEDGLSPPMSQGKAESGQAGLGGPPWMAPDAYLASSNIMVADKLTAPVLIIHGDLDEIRATHAQELFSALYRQAKDVVLLTYWGEGHVFGSPANIRHEYASILDWLARTMPPAPTNGAPTPQR